MNTTKITPDIFFSSLLFLIPVILLMHRYHLLKLLLKFFIEYITRCNIKPKFNTWLACFYLKYLQFIYVFYFLFIEKKCKVYP